MKKPLLSELTLEEKISQLLLLKQEELLFRKEDGKVFERTEEEIDAIIGENHFTGLWAYGLIRMDVANMAEQGEKVKLDVNRKVLERATKNAKIPYLIGMDCENGTGFTFSDGTKTVTGAAISASNDEELIYELNASIAREIKAAGGNWRWYPILDMGSRFLSGITRSIATNHETSKRIASAIIRGIQSEGVAATVKHFPGCDPYEYRDSHLVTTKINISYEEWEKTQGVFYRNAIEAGPMSFMSTHTAFPAVDDEMSNGVYVPATLSRKLIQGVLREKLGFNGVVVTDAIEMTGLRSYCSEEDILIRAINAGNDVLLGVRLNAFDIVYQAVKDGRIPMERIDESCQRVLDMKEKLGLFEGKKEEIDISAQTKKTKELNRKIAEKSITLIYDKSNMLPLSKENTKKVAIFCISHDESFIDSLEVMKAVFEEHGAETTIFDMPQGKDDVARIEEEYDILVYATFVSQHNPLGMPSLSGDQARIFAWSFSGDKSNAITVSMGYPYIHYDMVAGAKTAVNIYSPSPESQTAFVKALYGDIPFEGVSPFDLEPKMRQLFC